MSSQQNILFCTNLISLSLSLAPLRSAGRLHIPSYLHFRHSLLVCCNFDSR